VDPLDVAERADTDQPIALQPAKAEHVAIRRVRERPLPPGMGLGRDRPSRVVVEVALVAVLPAPAGEDGVVVGTRGGQADQTADEERPERGLDFHGSTPFS
jgi:hypothetical protein